MEDKTNSKVGVSGALLFKTDLSHNVSAGNFPNYKLFVKGSFWKLFYSKGFYETASRTKFPFFSDKPYKVDYVSGADFFVRKSIIDKIGGFDERFFMYGEDAELSFRIKNKLFFSSIIVPEAKIVHISQGSSENGSQSRKFKYQFIKSRATYYKITEGFIASALYFVTSLKRLYI
jgi:GT2 family glycosyltransferase